MCTVNDDAAAATASVDSDFDPVDATRLQLIACQEGDNLAAFDCKIHVLRNIADDAGSARGIQLGDHNTYHTARLIQHWTARIAGLNRRADLHVTRIVPDAGGRAHDAGREISRAREKTRQRKAEHDNRLAQHGVGVPH
jgi:hypothetical protein